MSSLLSEAIVDAKALKEAALKSAETAVIEKYSTEVKKTLDQLLEQDDLAAALGVEPEAGAEAAPMPAEEPAPMDAAAPEGAPESEEITEDEIPLAATDNFADLEGKNLNGFAPEGESVEVSIDLGALKEAVKELADSEEVEINEQTIADILSEEADEEDQEPLEEADDDSDNPEDPQGAGEMGGATGSAGEGEAQAAQTAAQGEQDKESGYGGTDENLERLVDDIMEKLTVDMGADLTGWAGRSSSDMKYAIEKELAHRRSTDVAEDLEVLKKAQEELVFENNQLTEQNNQYGQAIQELKESLQDVNLSNARLLYTNRVLRNTSLNERQKSKIVEAISGAGSVTEARTIFETLQSAVETTPARRPQTLGEAINRRSTSVLRATRKESTPSDPFSERMKRLAGIK